MTHSDATYLAWLGLSIATAVGAIYVLALAGFAGIELAMLAWAGGLVWAALTPRLVRWCGRWVRG